MYSRHTLYSHQPLSLAIAALLTIACLPTTHATAQVRFDAVDIVECHDVTNPEFAAIHPDERLVEAVFSISAFSAREDYRDIDFVYQIVNPNRTVRVVDYLPNTAVTSEYASNISHEESNDRTNTIGLNASGSVSDIVSLTGNAGTSNKKSSKLRYEKLPPTQVLSASGTLDRGAGVYFKLKPSSQTTLEGSRDYVVTLRVPNSWRGDTMKIHCRARRFEEGGLFSEGSIVSAGSQDFLVAMYLDVDTEAKHAAKRMVIAAQELQTNAKRYGKRMNSRNSGGFSLVSTSQPEFPSNWLSQIVFDPQPRSVPKYVKQMPTELRESVLNFARAKMLLQRMSTEG